MKKLFIFAVALATLSACSKTMTPENNVSYIGASILQTKTTLAPAATDVLWSDGDAIALVCGSSTVKGTISEGAGSTLAKFSYSSDDAPVYGVYPYAGASVSGSVATVNIPAEQAYSADQVFANDVAIMAGKASGSNIAFHNACAVVEVKLIGAGAIRNVTISSASSKLAGESTIDLTSDNPVTVPTANGSNSVTVSVPNGCVELNASEATSFYFVVAPGTYSDLKVTLNGQAVKASSASHIIEAGHVKILRALTVEKQSVFSYKWTLDADHIADQGQNWASINVLDDGSESGIAYDDTNAASLQFHQIQTKAHPSVTTNGVTGQYSVYKYAQSNTSYMAQNIWTGDYFELSAPVSTIVPNTCVELRFRFAGNNNGPKAWFVQYPDGSSWKNSSEMIAKPYGTTLTDDIPCTFAIDASGDGAMPVVKETVLFPNLDNGMKMRITCADGRFYIKNTAKKGSSSNSAGVYFYNSTSITFQGYTLNIQ